MPTRDIVNRSFTITTDDGDEITLSEVTDRRAINIEITDDATGEMVSVYLTKAQVNALAGEIYGLQVENPPASEEEVPF